MAQYLATDDGNLGAPHAVGGPREAFCLIAPASCNSVLGSVPPTMSFSRFDYTWLAVCLAACDCSDGVPSFLDSVFVASHTLAWSAVLATVSQAVSAGFSILQPSDVSHAVKCALEWSAFNRQALRPLAVEDFELLPPPVRRGEPLWWQATPFSAWADDGLLQALGHALGYTGSFWDVASRATDTRLHFSLLLTQEFLPVSASVPFPLFGDLAISFYKATMLPPKLLRFPTGVTGLLNALTIRWGYFHGTAVQKNLSLMAVLPIALKECVHLRRFLSPALNVASQAAAYASILQSLGVSLEPHRYETFLYVDRSLSAFINLTAQADAAPEPVYAESRATMLKAAVDAQRLAVSEAPGSAASAVKGEYDGHASPQVIRTLMDLQVELFSDLERDLKAVWSEFERRPVQVFDLALASKSLVCIAILFENISGVRVAGPMFSILEDAALERLNYFTVKLTTPKGATETPDHTVWFAYPPKVDKCVRSADYETFSKIDLFELGANIRRLRDKVKCDATLLPKPGSEFMSEQFLEHVHLLSYLGPWLDALGFELQGAAGFVEAFHKFWVFCQHGLHLRGRARDLHKVRMRDLYVAMLRDIHRNLRPFWSRRPVELQGMMIADQLFTDDGKFYTTHRQLMLQLERIEDMTTLGYAPVSVALHAGGKRPLQFSEGSSSGDRAPPGRRHGGASQRPDFAEVGSFSYAVRQDADTISILGVTYSKPRVLERLRLREDDICLPAFLSRKGAAACPNSALPGHEAMDSSCHVFSDEILALRPLFEQSPFRLPNDSAGFSRRGGDRGRGGRGGNGGRPLLLRGPADSAAAAAAPAAASSAAAAPH